MKATIGVYENHEEALEAIIELKKEGYPVQHIHIIGFSGTEDMDREMHLTTHRALTTGGVATGVTIGAAVGLLAGAGLLMIPGLGFLYSAGALVGALGGADLGLLGGGIITLLLNYGMHEKLAEKYETELLEGKYLLIVKGSNAEIEQAKDILTEHGTHTSLETYRRNASLAAA